MKKYYLIILLFAVNPRLSGQDFSAKSVMNDSPALQSLEYACGQEASDFKKAQCYVEKYFDPTDPVVFRISRAEYMLTEGIYKLTPEERNDIFKLIIAKGDLIGWDKMSFLAFVNWHRQWIWEAGEGVIPAEAKWWDAQIQRYQKSSVKEKGHISCEKTYLLKYPTSGSIQSNQKTVLEELSPRDIFRWNIESVDQTLIEVDGVLGWVHKDCVKGIKTEYDCGQETSDFKKAKCYIEKYLDPTDPEMFFKSGAEFKLGALIYKLTQQEKNDVFKSMVAKGDLNGWDKMSFWVFSNKYGRWIWGDQESDYDFIPEKVKWWDAQIHRYQKSALKGKGIIWCEKTNLRKYPTRYFSQKNVLMELSPREIVQWRIDSGYNTLVEVDGILGWANPGCVAYPLAGLSLDDTMKAINGLHLKFNSVDGDHSLPICFAEKTRDGKKWHLKTECTGNGVESAASNNPESATWFFCSEDFKTCQFEKKEVSEVVGENESGD